MRGDVLAALGVLKVATADHIWQLMCPGTKDDKPVRNACLDLQKHKLVLSAGQRHRVPLGAVGQVAR